MLKKSRIIALLLVCVMMFGVVQSAFAFSGKELVKDSTEKIVDKVGKIETVIDVIDRGKKLYDAKNNDERIDIVIDTAKDYGKSAVKTGVKTMANTTIAASATSTAVSLVGAAGMTAKTGTAIATLSGAAATNATLCAIGTPVASALGIAAAPAVVGGVIVAGAAAGVCYGVSCLIDWIW